MLSMYNKHWKLNRNISTIDKHVFFRIFQQISLEKIAIFAIRLLTGIGRHHTGRDAQGRLGPVQGGVLVPVEKLETSISWGKLENWNRNINRNIMKSWGLSICWFVDWWKNYRQSTLIDCFQSSHLFTANRSTNVKSNDSNRASCIVDM